MTQGQLADGFDEAGQSNSVAKALLLDGMCRPVAALELLTTMRPRRRRGLERLTYCFGGCDYRRTLVEHKIAKFLSA